MPPATTLLQLRLEEEFRATSAQVDPDAPDDAPIDASAFVVWLEQVATDHSQESYEDARSYLETLRSGERFAIRCTAERGAAWSNEDGWVDNDSYTTFTAAQRAIVNLPLSDAAWCTVVEMRAEQRRVASEIDDADESSGDDVSQGAGVRP